MAGSNRYELAIKALTEKDGHKMSPDVLRSFIKRKLASDDKIAAKYLNLMLEQGLLTETSPMIFLVNIKGNIDETN